jgi:hypothetical protein
MKFYLTLIFVSALSFSGCVAPHSSSAPDAESVRLVTSQEAYQMANRGQVVRDGSIVFDASAAQSVLRNYEVVQAAVQEPSQEEKKSLLVGNMPIVGASSQQPGYTDWTRFQEMVKEDKDLGKPLLMQLIGYFASHQQLDRSHCFGELSTLRVMLAELSRATSDLHIAELSLMSQPRCPMGMTEPKSKLKPKLTEIPSKSPDLAQMGWKKAK